MGRFSVATVLVISIYATGSFGLTEPVELLKEVRFVSPGAVSVAEINTLLYVETKAEIQNGPPTEINVKSLAESVEQTGVENAQEVDLLDRRISDETVQLNTEMRSSSIERSVDEAVVPPEPPRANQTIDERGALSVLNVIMENADVAVETQTQ